ncbi:cupin domain-containing protein [Robiginitomaculum antarcticum]|uniref:cupin domain-containing protein n=1 Tax=Robiginitomaculum antarcticum TaxID=437507 RepID=UPI00037745C9|nr:cupin domain-containing protein [Robiginitomaculum antarcticum]
MPKINIEDAPLRRGSSYPTPYDAPSLTRYGRKLGDAGGLTQFGAHLITLPPGAWSSQRHWHSAEDEFVYIVSGHPTLIDNDGPQRLSPGDCTAHPAGDENGHHMKNDTQKDVVFLIIGSRTPEIDSAHYPDIDLRLDANGTPDRIYKRKDGRQI